MKRVHVVAGAAIALAAAAAPAMAAPVAQKATSAQTAAMSAAVRASPVADVNQVPATAYSVKNAVVYKGSTTWGKVNLTSRSSDFQSSVAVLVRPAGGSAWTVVDVGSDDVGCRVVPVGVATAFKLGGPGCGIGNGYMAAPTTLKTPSLTGYQLVMRFFNYLNPQNQSKLQAFLADAFTIQRANDTALNKTQYLANHPLYNDAVLRVDSAQYAGGLLTVNSVNWQTTVPNVYSPTQYTFAWVDGAWQLLSFNRYAASPTMPAPLSVG